VIKQRKSTWPADVPGGNTVLDRSRTIAMSAIKQLAKHAPAEAEAIIRTAEAFGETWVSTHMMTNHSDLLTREEAALLAGVKPGTIRKWVQRGRVHYYPGGYSEREILDYLTSRRAAPTKPALTADPVPLYLQQHGTLLP
jgi:hypothetical protein